MKNDRRSQNAHCSSRKADKIKIARSLVKSIRSQNPPGRFLKKNPNSGLWHDIGDKRAIEKISQALREGQRNIMQNNVARKASEAEHSECEKNATISNNNSAQDSGKTFMQCNNENSNYGVVNTLLSGAGGQKMNSSPSSEASPHMMQFVNAGLSGMKINNSNHHGSLHHPYPVGKSFDEDELNQMMHQTFSNKGHLLHHHNVPRLPSINAASSTSNRIFNMINQEKRNLLHAKDKNLENAESQDDGANQKKSQFTCELNDPKPMNSDTNVCHVTPSISNGGFQGGGNLTSPKSKPNWFGSRKA